MIKKLILYISIVLIFTGCQTKENTLTNIPKEDLIIKNEEPPVDTYVDDNPIKLALYEGKNKVTSYKTTLSDLKDIAVFNIYYTDIDRLDSSNIKNNYNKYYSLYENINDYKNGFYITFEADGQKLEKLILDASSTYHFWPYMYIYLYDDINQLPNTYYSHLKEKDFNENTIISSIKLFLAEETYKITSPITITAFTYNDEEDFTEDNKYRGISSYTVVIETK